jgi:catechol 2,3-dioxygenase-like lactoylglutathione lyase family enzyme
MSGPTGVSELVLEVVDLEQAIRFYTEDLGLPLVDRWDHREAAWVMIGDRTRLGLWRPQVGLANADGVRCRIRRARRSAVPDVLSFAPRARLPCERRPKNARTAAPSAGVRFCR